MSVETLRPNATIVAGGATPLPSGTLWGVTSDDSDVTSMDVQGASTTLGFAEPIGINPLLEVRVRVRMNQVDQPGVLRIVVGGVTVSRVVNWSTPTTVEVGRFAPEDFDLTDVQLEIASSGPTSLNVWELYVDVVSVAQPTVDVTAPTGAITDTNLPLVEWEASVAQGQLDADGGEQTAYEVKLFNTAQYSALEFDPDVSEALQATGIVASGLAYWQTDVILPDDAYRAYVRVAQSVNDELAWSDWNYEAFTTAVPTPSTPAVTLTAENDEARIRIDLAAENLIPNPSFEDDDYTGWQANVGTAHINTQGFASTDPPIHGDWVLRVHTDGSVGNEGVRTASLTVTPSQTHTFSVWVRAYPGARLRVALQERTAADAVVGSAKVDFVGETPAVWRRVTVTRAFGATGVKARCIVETDDTVQAAEFWIDQAVLVEGPTVSTDDFEIQRSLGGGTWEGLRTIEGDGIVDDGAAIAWDLEVPNGTAADYRARSIHYTGTARAASAWESASGFWSSASYWLKHPYQPDLNVEVTLESMPTRKRAHRASVFQPLGRACPVIVSDTRGPTSGELVLMPQDEAQQAAIDALLDTVTPLLLQTPPDAKGAPDRWLVFTDHQRDRLIDKSWVDGSHDSLPWTAVQRPSGDLLAWPTPTAEVET